jgi:hypothetical protein
MRLSARRLYVTPLLLDASKFLPLPVSLLALVLLHPAGIRGAPQSTFTNPLFAGGDPWITFDDGWYYYPAASSVAGKESICLKKSRTLTGLI